MRALRTECGATWPSHDHINEIYRVELATFSTSGHILRVLLTVPFKFHQQKWSREKNSTLRLTTIKFSLKCNGLTLSNTHENKINKKS